jgi:hypothetical protein
MSTTTVFHASGNIPYPVPLHTARNKGWIYTTRRQSLMERLAGALSLPMGTTREALMFRLLYPKYPEDDTPA